MAQEGTDVAATSDRDGARTGRLKGVRKRKRAQQRYTCEVMALKMRLVKKARVRGK